MAPYKSISKKIKTSSFVKIIPYYRKFLTIFERGPLKIVLENGGPSSQKVENL